MEVQDITDKQQESCGGDWSECVKERIRRRKWITLARSRGVSGS